MEFLSLSRRRSFARNVPRGEERGETDVFAGYGTRNVDYLILSAMKKCSLAYTLISPNMEMEFSVKSYKKVPKKFQVRFNNKI